MSKPLLCIGHRGAMGHEPENTLSSIREALLLGAKHIEIDVYYVDGRLMVIHDDRLERTTNGKGYVLEQSFDYLRSLDAGGGQAIPTLEEVCEMIADEASINIELKGVGSAKPVAALINKLISNGWPEDRFLVSSFNHRELQTFKQLAPPIKIGALICALPIDDAAFAQALDAFAVNVSLEFIDQRFVDDAHQRGLKVYVYTVNHPDDIAYMHELGVDGVFSNYPERVIEQYEQGTQLGW